MDKVLYDDIIFDIVYHDDNKSSKYTGGLEKALKALDDDDYFEREEEYFEDSEQEFFEKKHKDSDIDDESEDEYFVDSPLINIADSVDKDEEYSEVNGGGDKRKIEGNDEFEEFPSDEIISYINTNKVLSILRKKDDDLKHQIRERYSNTKPKTLTTYADIIPLLPDS